MMTTADYIALAFFIFIWMGYSWLLRGRTFFGRTSLTHAMAERRREWIYNSLRRDLKMIDTQIMAGLQNGTAFFASTSIFADRQLLCASRRNGKGRCSLCRPCLSSFIAAMPSSK